MPLSRTVTPYSPARTPEASKRSEVTGGIWPFHTGYELHLFVYPLTRGPGPRLFPEDAAPSKLSLAACESYENGVVYLAYRP